MWKKSASAPPLIAESEFLEGTLYYEVFADMFPKASTDGPSTSGASCSGNDSTAQAASPLPQTAEAAFQTNRGTSGAYLGSKNDHQQG